MTNEDTTANDAPDKLTVYSVPRRYDLATLLAVTVAFAVLFAGLKLIKTQPEVFLLIVAFVAVVGLSQAIFAKAPRLASVLAGAGFFMVAFIVVAVMEGMQAHRLFTIVFGAWILSFVIQGAICGYVGGVLIGGVFLVADRCRQCMRRKL